MSYRTTLAIPNRQVEGGSYLYKGKYFDFVDYRSFCTTLFSLLLDEQLDFIIKNVAEAVVQDKSISMKTKAGWNRFFATEI